MGASLLQGCYRAGTSSMAASCTGGKSLCEAVHIDRRSLAGATIMRASRLKLAHAASSEGMQEALLTLQMR